MSLVRSIARAAVRPVPWIAHATTVLAVLAYVVLSALSPAPDADLGAVGGLVLIGVLGLPWTAPLMFLNLDAPLPAFTAIVLAGAIANLVFHASCVWRRKPQRQD